ncbi:MAG: hypothetical protein M5R36_11865 [Deltaproteobacteria bacterium]|nr:hypothetical protein [Deltaproteobacteria bacterium]
MMKPPQTTSLIDIRHFLSRHAAAPAPWDRPQTVANNLRALLEERAGDEQFWAELRDLMRRLDDHRFNAAAMKGSEALGAETVDALVDALRASIAANAPVDFRAWATRPMGLTALLAFLVLGTSFACYDSNESTGDGEWATADCGYARSYGLEGVDADVMCELASLVDESGISEYL